MKQKGDRPHFDSPPASPAAADHRARDLTLAALVSLLALLLRLGPMLHSLWYDEMFTLIHYVGGSWSNVFAGAYSPNNHVLFTILAKLITPDFVDFDTAAFLIRLPSLLAGAILPIALAWPLRKDRPAIALIIALIAAFHPWLISSSAFARGYALLLLLAVLATNALPSKKQPIHWLYAFLLLAMVYTHPLGVGVALGHGVAMLLLRRDLFWTWFRSAALAGIVTLLLYLPMFAGAQSYWSAPEKPSLTYTQFLDQTFRHAQAGYDAPGLPHLLTPLLILLAGSILAWRWNIARIAVVTFGFASLFGLIVPLAVPLAGEVRALHWLIPLYCIAAASLCRVRTADHGTSARDNANPAGATARGADPMGTWLTKASLLAAPILLIVFSLHVYAVWTIPAMPIRDAIARAKIAAPDKPLFGLYMASLEARALYGGIDAIAYTLETEGEMPALKPLEAAMPGATVVVFYEGFLARDEPELWDHLQANYQLVERLPGRISPAAIYRPR